MPDAIINVRLTAEEARATAQGLSSDLDRIGTSAATASGKGAAALAGLEQSSRGAATATVSSSAALRNYEQEIIAARGAQAALNQQIVESTRENGRNSIATKELRAAYVEQSAVLRVLIAEKAQLRVEATAEAAAERAAAAAAREKAVADGQAAAAAAAAATAKELSTVGSLANARAEQASALAHIEATAATNSFTEAFSRKTSMINTGQGPLRGYDGLVTTLARSLGGIPIAAAVGIPVVLALAQAFFKLNDEKERAIKLDEDGLKIDAERSVAMHTGTLFTKERAAVMADFTAMNVVLKQALIDLTEKEKAEEEARRANTEAMLANKQISNEQYMVMGMLGQTQEQLTKKEVEATAARLTATAEVHKQVEAYVKLALETHLSAEATLEMARRTGDSIQVINALTAALDSAYFATLRFKSGQSLISETKFKVAHDAAAAGETLNHAEAQRRYNERLAEGGEETRKLAHETELTEKNLKAFSETHHRGVGAARAYANALVDLRKKMEESQAALIGDNFAARDAKIEADINAEREHLRINKRDKEEALVYIAGREKALHDKVAQDRAIAEQRLNDEIREIEIRGIQDAYERESAGLKLKLQQKTLTLYQEFGATEQSEQHVFRMKRGYEDEFIRWFVERNIKMNDDLNKIHHDALQKEHAERAREGDLALKQSLKDFEQYEKEIAALIDRFGQRSGGHVAILDVRQLDDINSRLNKLGLSVRGVDQFFGHTTSSIRAFELRLQALEKFGKGDFFGGLKASLKSIVQDMLESGQAAQVMGNLIEGAFSNAAASGGNFIAELGASLIEGMTAIVAQVLGQLGIQLIAKGIADVLQGIAWNANPLTPGAGTALIAAGHAEIVQGAAFSAIAGIAKGLGSLAANAIRGNGSSSGASPATGASSGTGAAGNQQRQPSPPKMVPFPTSPPAQQIVVVLDRQGTKDFLEGQGVVTDGRLSGASSPSHPLNRKINRIVRS